MIALTPGEARVPRHTVAGTARLLGVTSGCDYIAGESSIGYQMRFGAGTAYREENVY